MDGVTDALQSWVWTQGTEVSEVYQLGDPHELLMLSVPWLHISETSKCSFLIALQTGEFAKCHFRVGTG